MSIFKNKLTVIVILGTVMVPFLLFAQQDLPKPQIDYGMHKLPFEKSGMAGWQFLQIPSYARSMAMAGITTAVAHGDASAALGNPASIADVENFGVSTNTMNWIADIKFHSAAVVKNMGSIGSFGLGIVYLDAGEMYRTENQDLGGDFGIQPVTDLGTFTAGDLAVGLSYARVITDRLQVGGNLRFVQETIDDASASAWTIDIGTMYKTGLRSLRLSMMGRNFGADAEFGEYNDQIGIVPVKIRMPMSFLVGVAYDILEGGDGSPHLWTIAAEFVHPNDGPEKVHAGTEYTLMDFATLRAGYRYNYDEQGLTVGGALNLTTAAFKVSLGYSYMDFGRLGSVNMFTVGIN